jgi:hypothetical protein
MKQFRFTVPRQSEGAIDPARFEQVLTHFLSVGLTPEVCASALPNGGVSVEVIVFDEPDADYLREQAETTLANSVYVGETNPALTTSPGPPPWLLTPPTPPWRRPVRGGGDAA